MRRALAVVAAAAIVAVACGGHLAVPDDGGTPEGGLPEGGPGPDVEPVDVQPPIDVAPPPEDSPGPCEPDGVPCIGPMQCCSGVCAGNRCGPQPPPPPPQDGGPPPPQCAPGPNSCTACVAALCCPQLMECEADSTCTAFLNCFDKCYAQGNGPACAMSCQQQYSDVPVQQLVQCGAGACGPKCM
jgi:hypothetical protein